MAEACPSDEKLKVDLVKAKLMAKVEISRWRPTFLFSIASQV